MKEQLKELLQEVLGKLAIDYNGEIPVEIPKDNNNGDYASSLALQLTKVLHQNPKVIAENIKKELEGSRDYIEKIEIAGPGFINFFVSNDYLFDNLKTVINEKDNYGRNNLGNGEKINLEYVSANPTGLLHLGHARGAAFGDSLAKILKFSGYDVTREYYINDAGNQMNNLGISIKSRYLNLCGIDSELPENGYHGKEIITIAEEIFNEFKDSKKDEDVSYFKKYGLDILLDQIKIDLGRFGVSFDVWTSEQSIYDRGLVQEVLNKLIEKGYTYEEDGALFLKTTMYGDEKDRVLVKQDGAYTYLLPDIAYHTNKFSRDFESLVDVLGSDHHGYIARLKASLKMLGYDAEKINVMILQMVRLLKDGEELKLSKRTGKTVTISELMDEVGPDVVRYFFVSKSLDTQMDFDIDLAVRKSNENPFYYINYAHARICSMLKDEEVNLNITKFETISSDSAYNVLKKVYEWPEVVKKTAYKKEVHPIANYAYELASLFHNYYASEKILTDDTKYTNERLILIKAVQITLRNALTLIGLKAYEQM